MVYETGIRGEWHKQCTECWLTLDKYGELGRDERKKYIKLSFVVATKCAYFLWNLLCVGMLGWPTKSSTLLSDTGLCEPFVIGLDDPLQYFLSCVCQSGKPRWPPTQDKVLTWSLWEN